MDEIERKLKEELGEEVKQNQSLRDYASIGVGGVADFFYTAKTIDQLVNAVTVARKLNLPYFILGGGYNIIPSDSGFFGLVIKNETSNIAFDHENSQVIADSGVNLSRLINLAAGYDLGGIEFLFGIPGTVGGAIYNNAGAFGSEIGDFVKSVILLVSEEDKPKIFRKGTEWMNFSYRSTRLKEGLGDSKHRPVILTVKIQLARRRKDEILNLVRQAILKKKQAQPLEEKSAGSFFKNPGVVKEKTAGFLLDRAGAKKIRIGGAAVSKKHADFIINRKNATASDIRKLADKVRAMVKIDFDIELEEEVEYIGKW